MINASDGRDKYHGRNTTADSCGECGNNSFSWVPGNFWYVDPYPYYTNPVYNINYSIEIEDLKDELAELRKEIKKLRKELKK